MGTSAGRHRVLGWCGAALIVVCGFALLPLRSAASGRPEPPTEVLAGMSERPGGDPAAELVVRVRARGCGGASTGSGVLLAGGVVLTARHVLDGAATATVDVPGLAPLVAPVVAVDAGGRDAAILRLPPSVTFSAATVAGRAPAPATPVAVLGHVRGGTTQRRSGAVVGFVTTGPLALDGGRVMTVDVAFEPGMSGGPVVDTAGRVVGVAIGVERNSGTGIAVPVDELEALLDGEGDPPSPGCGESR